MPDAVLRHSSTIIVDLVPLGETMPDIVLKHGSTVVPELVPLGEMASIEVSLRRKVFLVCSRALYYPYVQDHKSGAPYPNHKKKQ